MLVGAQNRPVTELAPNTWWDEMVTRADRPIRELVAGLDDVAGLAIPYARLPRRARNAYSADFSCWADIGGQSVDSLLSRPHVGEVAVRAVLEAAKDAVAAYRAAAAGSRVGAVAAVRRLLDQLGERDRVILSARVWAARPQSQRIVAERLAVHSVSVQRNQPRAEARLAEMVADPVHHEVGEYAVALRGRLGPYVPEDVVASELRRLDVDPSGETAQVLLYLAGPYVRRGNWLENTKTSGQQQVVAAVDAVFDRCPAPSTASLVEVLTGLGMPNDVATAYLETRVALRRFGGAWVRWGDSIPDKAEAVLHARGAPVTSEDILAGIGADSTALRGVREALYADDRFVRASRLTWGLRAWGIDEYAGVFDEIGARIDASGGQMKIDDVVRDVLSHVPDVAENSVRTYLGTLAFVTEAGMVRRRTDTDEYPPIAALNTARGAFHKGANEIRLAITVTIDMLRGSGLQLRPPWPTRLGSARGSGAYLPARTARCPSLGGCHRPTGPA